MRALVPQFILDRLAKGKLSGRFPAACLHIDISGFAASSEALMGHGKAGAERLADILQALFEPLVGAVYEQDGFIANFAGDGFTAVFSETVAPSGAAAPIRDFSPEGSERSLEKQRALAAAWIITQQLAPNPAFDTLYGVFTFAVKAIVTAGTVEWHIWQGKEAGGQQAAMLAGQSEAQSAAFSFTGPGIVEGMAGERWAEPGDLLLSRPVYERLQASDPGLLQAGPVDGPAGFLRVTAVTGSLPQPLVEGSAELPSPSAAATPFYNLNRFNLAIQGEFRHVLTNFLHLRSMPDAHFMNAFFRLLHQYGGYLCRMDDSGRRQTGPRFLLFWGAPTSYENDIERARDFVLDLKMETGVSFRAGLTYQIAYAGFVGSPLREEYTCYGPRVNLAERQMAAAGWGDVWLDEEIAGRATDRFEMALVGHLPFKGFADDRPVFALQGHREARPDTFYRGRLVGREREMGELAAAVRPILKGEFAGVVIVTGEAGIGKSRLVAEFLRTWEASDDEGAPPHQVLLAQADEIRRQSLNPFRYLLRHYFSFLPMQSEEENRRQFDHIMDELVSAIHDQDLQAEVRRTRSFLGALLDLRWTDSLYERLEPKLRLQNTLVALKNLIVAESLRQPLIILLEDFHWLDDDSLSFLEDLTRGAAGYPFVIIATSRERLEVGVGGEVAAPLFPAAGPQKIIDLETLSEAEAGDLAAAILEEDIAPELRTLLVERTDGNPFFVEQVALYLQEQGLLLKGEEGLQPRDADAVLPADVQAILVARLDGLAQSVRQVVQTASVLGREFSVRVLSQMLREDPAVMDKVETAEEAAIWSAVSEIRYLFRHALLRDAAYEMQLRARLRALHQLAGEAIEGLYAADLSPHYADLAYHYRQAEITERERHYARLAGEQAAARFANAESVAYLSRALELTPDTALRERFDLLLAREKVFQLEGNREAQARDLPILQALAGQIGDDSQQAAVRQAQVALRRAIFSEITSDYPAAVTAAKETVRLARLGQDAELEAAGRIRWIVALWRQGYYEGARDEAERTLSLTREAGTTLQEGHALLQLGNVNWFMGHYALAGTYYEQALDIYRQLDHPTSEAAALLNLGLVSMNQGDYASTEAYTKQASEKYRQIGSRRSVAHTLTTLGSASKDQGHFDAAIEYYESALPITRETGDRNSESITLASLGDVFRKLGDYGTAAGYYEENLLIAQELGNRRSESLGYGSQALLHHLQGENEEAYDLIQTALSIDAELGLKNVHAFNLTVLGHVLTELERLDEARAAYQEALAIRREFDELNLAAEVMAGLARVALASKDATEARGYVDEILNILEERTLDATEEAGRVYLSCYRVLAAHQDPRAEEVLRAGYGLLQRRAASISDEERKHLYLSNVAAHREIVREYGRHNEAL